MLHIDSADRAMLGDAVNEDGIRPGEFMFAVEGGGFRKATGADSRVDGIVEDFSDDHIADHEEDYRTSLADYTYDASNGDNAAIGGAEDAARLRARTPADNGTDPAPAIQQWSVVGIPDAGSSFAGRIVEEGYTNAAATTFDRATGNFNVVGLAMGSDPKTHVSGSFSEYDGLIHVLYRSDL